MQLLVHASSWCMLGSPKKWLTEVSENNIFVVKFKLLDLDSLSFL